MFPKYFIFVAIFFGIIVDTFSLKYDKDVIGNMRRFGEDLRKNIARNINKEVPQNFENLVGDIDQNLVQRIDSNGENVHVLNAQNIRLQMTENRENIVKLTKTVERNTTDSGHNFLLNLAEQTGDLDPNMRENGRPPPNFAANISNCDLACWLNFTIHIPDVWFEKGGFNMSISGMECGSNHLGNITSSYTRERPTQLQLALLDLGTTCSANWVAREVYWPHIEFSGKVVATVNNSNLQVNISLEKQENGLAKSAHLDLCQTKIKIANLQFSGGITSDILQLFEGPIKNFVQSELDTVVCQELTQLIDTNLTSVLQMADREIEPYLKPRPPSPTRPVPPGMLDLLGNPMVDTVAFAIDDLLGPKGLLSINKVVDKFTNNSGEIYISNQMLEDLGVTTFTFAITDLANITLGITSLSAAGLNTWGTVNFKPVGNYSLEIHTEMDIFDLNVTFFVNVTAFFNDKWLYEEGQLIMKLNANSFYSLMQLAIKEDVLKTLEPQQYIFPGCIESAVFDAEIAQTFFNTTVRELTILALNGDLEKDLDAAIDNILALFTNSFGLAIPAFFNGPPIRKEANDLFYEWIMLNQTCPAGPAPTKPFNTFGATAAFTGAGILFIILAVVLIFVQKKRSRKSIDPTDLSLLGATPKDDKDLPCLALDPQIPFLVRFGIPVLLLSNIALFIASNTSVGASIYFILQLDNETFKSPSLFNFSLGGTVRDMWHAGVYPLALLIAVFSGAWPYIKLIAMLLCWLLPPRILKVKTRDSCLMLLDTLGKWSLIDAFVMILMAVAFRFKVENVLESNGEAPDIPLHANVYVQPQPGFYTFLLATMTSLFFTHLIIFFHHKASDPPRREGEGTEEEEKESLCNHQFRVNQGAVKCTPFGQSLVAIFLIMSSVLLGVGSYLDTFNFNCEGGAALALELLGSNPKRSYSVISLGNDLPASNEHPNSFGIRWIQVTYFLFTLVFPILHLLVLFVLWLIALKPSVQRKIFTVTEILDAWSALDVFVVSIIAAILEIQQFVQFIIGDKCDEINEILKEHFDKELNGKDVCFDVVATLNAGCWILFAASVLYLIAGSLVMRTCHKAIQQMNNNNTKKSINNGYTVAENSSVEEDEYELNPFNKPKKKKFKMIGCFVALSEKLHLTKPVE